MMPITMTTTAAKTQLTPEAMIQAASRFAKSTFMKKVALTFAVIMTAMAMVGAGAATAHATENEVNPYQRPDSSFIYDTLISDLASADSYFDGQTVQVTGEAVGDAIRELSDPEHRWITVQATDGSGAQIAVYMSAESASRIDTFGAYGKMGTTLQVRGTFNLACDEHEGLSDLHADSVSVVEPGAQKHDVFKVSDFVPGLVLVVVGLILVAVFYRVRERQR